MADRWEGLVLDPTGPVFELGPLAGKNAVESRGQSVTLPTGRYTQAWVLAFSTAGLQKAVTFETVFADGSNRKTAADISDWRSPATARPDELVETAPSYLAPSGLRVFLGASLYKYAVPLSPREGSSAANTLRLPNNPQVKILALTLWENPEPEARPSTVAPEGQWLEVPGNGRDFVTGPDGRLSLLSADAAGGVFGLLTWNGADWEKR